jgi:FKBP-type peptidyl-prolyl cis-trans isomerase FklB
MNEMKYVALAGLSILFVACQGNTQDKAKTMKTMQDSVSYSIGLDIGKNLKQQSVDVNPEMVAQGIGDIQSGTDPKLTEGQVRDILTAFQEQMVTKHNEKNKVEGEKNKKEGEVFLAENKKDKDVVTLASGLQYKVMSMGTGKKPAADATVTVNYSGTLIDGTEFDSSFKRGEPATFPVNGVIKGWTEALQLMPVGSKWKLFIPSNLAYGESGAGGMIGPNSTLIFEVELLAIK